MADVDTMSDDRPKTDLEAVSPEETDNKVKKKLPYPKSVFFIISNEFCERFSYYGMRTILALYLHQGLGYSEDMSTVIYHVFVMLCYFTPLAGGIMADSWLGKYQTIFWVSILYAIGNIVLAIGSIQSLPISHVGASMAGLVLIGVGTGGIKPCVSSFGGDQFVMPEQEQQLKGFFSVFYFMVNAGSVISSFFTPMMRENISCLGQRTCDPLAFGVPAVLMVVSIIFFVSGRSMYKMKKPGGNIMTKVCKCIGHAIVRKVKTRKTTKRDHWLDYADDEYSQQLIDETKILLNLTVLFSPTIVFWALYEQQGSRWTFQASHMNGYMWGFNMDPDQIQTLNPVLVLIFIPIFDKGVYPLFEKLRLIRTPLQKLSWGGLLAAVAFLVSGFLEMQIQDSYPLMPHSNVAYLRVFNNLNCSVSLNTGDMDLASKGLVKSMSMLETLDIPVSHGALGVTMNGTAASDCGDMLAGKTFSHHLDLYGGQIGSYLVTAIDNELYMEDILINGTAEVDKSTTTKVNPKFKLIYGTEETMQFALQNHDAKYTSELANGTFSTKVNDALPFGVYDVILNNTAIEPKSLQTGGFYTLLIGHDGQNTRWFTITQANTVSMLWQIPQYFIITFAEIMFSITGLEFSYSESPDSMKSVISSIWLITDAFGNIIILIIAGFSIFDNKAYEFFLYAALMAVVMGIFIILAMKYKYATTEMKATKDRGEIEQDNSQPNDTVSTL